MARSYTGITEKTPKNLLLDAGVLYINFDLEVDTPATAKAKILGATAGGTSFSAVPEIRKPGIDGAKGSVKGLHILEFWEVSMKTTLIEFTPETFAKALGVSDSEEVKLGLIDYAKITPRDAVAGTDYIDNITLATRLSGSNEPVYIQIFNALSTGGFSVDYKDADDITAEITFEANYDPANLDNPIFNIHFPKRAA